MSYRVKRFLDDCLRRQGLRRLGLLSLLLLAGCATWLWAHEGHRPLPSKGAEVDLEKGIVVLARTSAELLDLQTDEVRPRPTREVIRAAVTLHSPWDGHAYAGPRLGGRVTALHARPGQVVKAGQVLAEVESLELKGLALELRNAATDLRLAEQALREIQAASRGGAVSEVRLLEAQTRRKQAAHSLELARSKWLALDAGQEGLRRVLAGQGGVLSLPVRSPLSGVVIHADQSAGKVVEPAEHLFEIVDPQRVWARLGVLERDFSSVTVGQPVELMLTPYPGEVFRTTLEVQGADLDARTHLGSAWVRLRNPPGQEARFLPGMTGVALLIRPGSNRTLGVPREALVRQGVESFVFVEESATAKEAVYRRQQVVLAGQDEEFALVLQGDVYPGDRVVTRGSRQLGSFFVPGVLRPSPQAAASLGLAVEPASRHVVEETIEVEGSVEVPPDRRVLVSSQLPGTLVSIHVERGQVVQPDQVVAELASAELLNLQLDLLRAHLDRDLASENLRRLRETGANLPPRLALEMEAQRATAQNRHDTLTQKLKALGLTEGQLEDLRRTRKVVPTLPLRAAKAGRVVRFERVLGQGVKAEEPLFEIHDLSSVWVRLHLSESELPRVWAGQEARVRLTAHPGVVLEGAVVRSAGRVDPGNQLLSGWVELSAAPGVALLHNMLARVTLVALRPAPVLALPRKAVVREGSKAFVFVRAEDGTFAKRPVRTGRADDRYFAILEGIHPGEPVAVRGAAGLLTGHASLR